MMEFLRRLGNVIDEQGLKLSFVATKRKTTCVSVDAHTLYCDNMELFFLSFNTFELVITASETFLKSPNIFECLFYSKSHLQYLLSGNARCSKKHCFDFCEGNRKKRDTMCK